MTGLFSFLDCMATAELPAANVRHDGFDAAEYETLSNVPVFAEHETTVRDGRRLKFGRNELQAIVDRCNRRILETGDYAAVTLGHTPSPDSADQTQPDLVGFAGPFRIGTLGQGPRQRYAILADMHIRHEDLSRVKRHPRRSPELWLEDRFEEMFLDPIALLGAEAPRLDMGLLYSAQRNGRQIEKYAAACAGPTNTSVHSHTTGRPGMGRYAADPNGEPAMQGTSVLTPEDIQAVVEAVMQTEPMQWALSQMQAQSPEGAGAEVGEGGMGEVPDEGNPFGEEEAAPEGEVPAAAADAPAEPPAAAAPPEVPAEKKEPIRNAAGMRTAPTGAKTHYEAGGSADGDDTTPTGTAEGEMSTTPASSADPKTDNYRKTGDAARFSKMQSELADVKRRLEAAEKLTAKEAEKRVDAERYSALREKRFHYAFDLDKEVERCRYGKMNQAQFGEHLEAIDANYRPIPDGEVFVAADAGHSNPERPGVKERYSREHRDRALQIAERKAIKGEDVDYLEVLEQVAAGKL